MTLKPYQCIHCKVETQTYAVVHMRFERQILEHVSDHYGNFNQYYPKGTELMDMGEVPVFVCDKCVRAMQLFGKHYAQRLALASLLVLISLSAALGNLPLWLCAVPFAGVFLLFVSITNDYSGRAQWQHRNNMLNEDKRIAMISATSEGLTMPGIVSLPVMLVIIVLSIFLKGTPLRILAWVLAAIGGVNVLSSLLGMLVAHAKPNERTYQEAARYYILYDENIRLK